MYTYNFYHKNFVNFGKFSYREKIRFTVIFQQSDYTSRFLLTGYVGLILRSTAVATTSHGTVTGTTEGTLQLLHGQ